MAPLDRVRLSRLGNAIPIEEYEDDTSYVLRAELPGVNAAKDISVMVADGELTVVVERLERYRARARSEFRYGTFRRTVVLPRRAKDATVAASYTDAGILEVTVELTRMAPIGRTVAVRPDAVGPLPASRAIGRDR